MSISISLINERLLRLCLQHDLVDDQEEIPNESFLTDRLMAAGRLDARLANVLLEEATGCPAVDPNLISFASSFITHISLLLSTQTLLTERVFPIKHEENHVHLVMANPMDEACIARMESATGARIKAYCCNSVSIKKAIGEVFPNSPGAEVCDFDVMLEKTVSAIHRIRNEQQEIDFWSVINHAQVIHLLRMLFSASLEQGASDIHFEPLKDRFRIRARLDGVLHTIQEMDPITQMGIIARIKMISGMKLDITAIPQDGRIDYHVVPGKEIDIRVSVLPSLYGEKAVLRILDKGKNRLKFSDLKMAETQRQILTEAINRPNGLVLVTGPTGSGKTTTLYAFLAELNNEEVNITTAEDPVEYELQGINQVNCDQDKGLTYGAALKSFLRQDPDIIMIAEVRDSETADIAVKAALTGHLVFSTLHTNDAPGAVTRIVNLGVPPFLLASCGLTVLAQRLLRTICPFCKVKHNPDHSTLTALGLETEAMDYFIGQGCPECSGTGYKGRVAIMEILTVNEEIERLILEQRPVAEIKRAALDNGMITLRQDALNNLHRQITTPEEVLRITIDA